MELRIEYEHPIRVNAFRWEPKPYKQELHVHNSLEIGCCVSGKGRFFFGGKVYEVRPGDIFLVGSHEPHIAVSDPQDPSVYIFINFDPILLLQEDGMLLLPFSYIPDRFDNRIPAEAAEAQSMARLMESILEECRERRQGYCSLVKGQLIELCVRLFRACSDRIEPGMDARRFDEKAFRFMGQMIKFMETNFREPIGLNDLAKELGLSSAAASRYCKEIVGRSFSEYLQELRIREAKRLLASTDRSVTDIAMDSGFQSQASFFRLFKSQVGCSPQAYRSRSPSAYGHAERSRTDGRLEEGGIADGGPAKSGNTGQK